MDKIFKKWNKYVHSYNENSIKRQNLISATHVVIDLIKEAKKEVFDDIDEFIKVGDRKECFGSIVRRLEELKEHHLSEKKD